MANQEFPQGTISYPTVTFRGSGTDLATDLRSIVPPRKLQDMVDSLIKTGHVRQGVGMGSTSGAHTAMDRLVHVAEREASALEEIAAVLGGRIPTPTGETTSFETARARRALALRLLALADAAVGAENPHLARQWVEAYRLLALAEVK